jgi:hypothetical protein
MKTPRYEVIVGNIGTVYSGNNGQAAQNYFKAYVANSKCDSGRAAGESVTLLAGGEIAREYAGTLATEDSAQ